jgi:hypothetical protein
MGDYLFISLGIHFALGPLRTSASAPTSLDFIGLLYYLFLFIFNHQIDSNNKAEFTKRITRI